MDSGERKSDKMDSPMKKSSDTHVVDAEFSEVENTENIRDTSSELVSDAAPFSAKGGDCFSKTCCCFVISLLIVVCAGAFVFSRGISFFEDAVQGMGESLNAFASKSSKAANKVWAVAVKIWNKEPNRIVKVSYIFQGAKATDKYIIAEVRDTVNESSVKSSWGIFKGDIKIDAQAVYKYYIPLMGMKYEISRNKNGKYDFVFYFDSLKLDEPVSYKLEHFEINQSKFSNSVNSDLSKFVSDTFPQLLKRRGESLELMEIARSRAEDAMREYIRRNILPAYSNGDKIGDLKIIFGDVQFESFKGDIVQKIKEAPPKIDKASNIVDYNAKLK